MDLSDISAFEDWAVRLNTCGNVRCEPGWRLGPTWSAGLKDFDFWYVRAGRGLMKIDGRELDLHPGVAVWMRPGTRYEAEQDCVNRLGVCFLHFNLSTRGRCLGPRDVAALPEILTTWNVDFVTTASARIAGLMNHPDVTALVSPFRKSAEHLFRGLLLSLLLEQNDLQEGERVGLKTRHYQMITQLLEQIREDPGRNWRVAALARHCGYSADHFTRIFHKITGMAPESFVVQCRVNRARQLLAESDLMISQIADVLGYSDPFFFSRQFKAHVGASPRDYRSSPGRI